MIALLFTTLFLGAEVMKYKYKIKEISKESALEMIRKYHYSNTLPKLNKYFIGFFLDEEMVGVITLGYGTRPRHTIQCLFPSLDTKDYLEIGRMAMLDSMPRNSESQMLSCLIKWLKTNHPEIKVLFTWADGILGKCGYVYQASNFHYFGYYFGEIYLKDGVKIHVRQMKSILSRGVEDKRITVRPTLDQMRFYNIQHIRGKQYKYVYFLCGNKIKNQLLSECLVDTNIPRPKDNDLKWEYRDLSNGRWYLTDKPVYKTDFACSEKKVVGIDAEQYVPQYKQLSLFEQEENI